MRWWCYLIGLFAIPLILIGAWRIENMMRKRPAAYLDFALDQIERHAVRVPHVDWPEIRAEAERRGGHAKTAAETYPAIRFALRRVDVHSFLMSPYDAGFRADPDYGLSVLYPENIVYKVWPASPADRASIRIGDRIESVNGRAPAADERDRSNLWVHLPGDSVRLMVRCRSCDAAREITLRAEKYDKAWTFPPRAQAMGAYVAYVEVPGNEMIDTSGYARRLREVIKTVGASRRCGWVIDLRRCGGGNMWPMLQPMRGILGDANPGYFVTRSDRTAWENTYKSTDVTDFNDAHNHSRAAVAVLTSRLTNSAGESVAIAFRGRPYTRSFGEPTRGHTTANRPFPMPDGITMWVSVAHQADRNGRVYYDKIVPDQETLIDWQRFATLDDPSLEAAIGWIRRQPPCRNLTEPPTAARPVPDGHEARRVR